MKLKKIFLLSGGILAFSVARSQSSLKFIDKEPLLKKHIVQPSLNIDKKNISPSMLISPFFYSDHLSFFCRQEIKFEKATKIPFKFRLGSVQYVDYLERKPNAVFLPR